MDAFHCFKGHQGIICAIRQTVSLSGKPPQTTDSQPTALSCPSVSCFLAYLPIFVFKKVKAGFWMCSQVRKGRKGDFSDKLLSITETVATLNTSLHGKHTIQQFHTTTQFSLDQLAYHLRVTFSIPNTKPPTEFLSPTIFNLFHLTAP